MSYVYIFICKEDVVLEHANVKCHLCTLWWTCETCKGKLSKHRSKGNFKLLMIYMDTENPEIQKPYESLRSSLQLAWISSLCYFQPCKWSRMEAPGIILHLTSIFVAQKVVFPPGKKYAERNETKIAMKTLESLWSIWKVESSKFEIQTYHPHPTALRTGKMEAELWFSKWMGEGSETRVKKPWGGAFNDLLGLIILHATSNTCE